MVIFAYSWRVPCYTNKNMLGLLLVMAFGALAVFYRQAAESPALAVPAKLSSKLDQLWEIAQESLHDKKYLRAEKALLTILRVDERNAAAYNRLGILYAKQKAFTDAIECFEIAQSLESSASSLHNVGLIYFETGNYDKAALAFEQALGMESDLAARHIAYAKVQEKLGNTKKMIESLEKAVELDPIPQTLNILADAYERAGESELSLKLREKAAKMIIPPGQPKRIVQPRRVM
jgi:tetratricopeptide (TPR) repeat protein